MSTMTDNKKPKAYPMIEVSNRPQQSIPPSLFTKLTLSQVARHKTASSCWMVIDSKVYDVTSFLQEHPGGDDILVDSSGRDATREFEDVGHSGDARAQLKELFVGDLREPTEAEVAEAAEEALTCNDKPKNMPSAWVTALARYLLPFLIVGAAFLLRNYAK